MPNPTHRGKGISMKGRQGFQPKTEALTDDERQQVLHWLGEFVSPNRIPALIQETFGKTVSAKFAYPLLKTAKWQPIIDRYRQEWLVNVLDVPLANKKVRLEKLQRQLEKLEAAEGQVSADRYQQRLLKLMEAARLEMEPSKTDQTTNYFFANINQCSDEELLQRRAELVKRIQEFRWPNTRRITNGVGHGFQEAEASEGVSPEGAGGDGGVGDIADLSTPEGPSAG